MRENDGHTTARDWFWPVLVMLMIFAASSQSHVAGPPIAGFDKVAHFFAYGLLGTLLARVPAFARVPWGVFAAVALASLYGVSDEFHQSFTPGRSVDAMDWLADTSGAALAVLTYRRWRGYRRLLESPLPANARVDLPAVGSSD